MGRMSTLYDCLLITCIDNAVRVPLENNKIVVLRRLRSVLVNKTAYRPIFRRSVVNV